MDCSLPGSSVHGDSPGAGRHALLQGIFPTQGLNPYVSHLLHRQVGSLPLAHLRSPSLPQCSLKHFFPSSELVHLLFNPNPTYLEEI